MSESAVRVRADAPAIAPASVRINYLRASYDGESIINIRAFEFVDLPSKTTGDTVPSRNFDFLTLVCRDNLASADCGQHLEKRLSGSARGGPARNQPYCSDVETL